MPPDKERSRPGEKAASHSIPNSLTIVDPRDDIARHIGGTLVVAVEATAGKYRRRCFLSVMSAEKALSGPPTAARTPRSTWPS
jgi:hypothetical protein